MKVLHQNGPLPTSSTACLIVSPGRTPYTIFVVAAELLFYLVVMKRLRFPCILGAGGGGGGERKCGEISVFST